MKNSSAQLPGSLKSLFSPFLRLIRPFADHASQMNSNITRNVARFMKVD